MCAKREGGDGGFETDKGSRTVGTADATGTCAGRVETNILRGSRLEASVSPMGIKISGKPGRLAAVLCLIAMAATAAVPASKNMAVVVATGSKLSDVALADLAKLCKGAQKSWPDGKNFFLVMKSPESPEMRLTVLKLFGDASGDIKAAIAKVNESHSSVKIMGSEEDLLRTVEATPGAIGILDVYAINSSVKVLRVDGKLPFDVGYAFRGN